MPLTKAAKGFYEAVTSGYMLRIARIPLISLLAVVMLTACDDQQPSTPTATPTPAPVTIVLPATTDCEAQGAICTGDGRKLSNSLSFTVSGRETRTGKSIARSS